MRPEHYRDVERAWDVEIERRIQSIDDVAAKLIPAEEVFRRLHPRQ